jgi:hypothetical protein
MNMKNIKKERLAEFIGILLGDGSLSLKSNNPTSINRLKITLNSKDDIQYLSYIKNLILELFNAEPNIKFRKNENTVDVFLFKKEIIEYLVNEVGLKLSPKWNNATIPSSFNSKHMGLHVLRGYFDTDGCLATTNNNGTIYPRLEMKICPSPMQKQFIETLKTHNFKFGVYSIGRGEVRIQLNGKKQLKKWLESVGFSNIKHGNKIKRFFKS